MQTTAANTAFTAEEIRQRKITKKGLSLNILLIGENGIGKRTFANTLSNTVFFPEEIYLEEDVVKRIEVDTMEDLKIETHIIDVVEQNSTPIKLNIGLTKNFGHNIDNSGSYRVILDHILEEYETFLSEESKINRNPYLTDKRIHVGLYFLRATSRELNEFDIQNMKQIGDRINLIPVISKADTLTQEELEYNKYLIRKSIADHNIPVFNFLKDVNEQLASEELEDYQYIKEVDKAVPFGIISSNIVIEGQRVRVTTWGRVNIEDENNCDCKLLRNVLLGSHLQDFKDATISTKYEAYRVEQLMKQFQDSQNNFPRK
ncbi:hypothetical protein G9P44_002152 [Scheffersomyces stipitis]|nr:hypothetical protein G9P44_002152 [Scheffersomyces stipitis]